MKVCKIFFTVFAASMLIPLLTAQKAGAIPAFARQYKTECSTCHTIYPQRNEFGDAFKKNGYVMPGKKAEMAKEENQTASGWPTGIPETLPLSVMGVYDIIHNKDAEDNLNLKSYELEMFAGGNFQKKISFFAIYVLGGSEDEDGKQVDVDSEVEEAFIMYRQVFGSPLNIKAGKFMPQLSLWKENNKLIEATPATIDYTVDDLNGESPLTEPQAGIELNAVLIKRLFMAGGFIDPKDRDVHVDEDGNEVSDKGVRNRKDIFGHISYKIGGTDFLGNEPDVSFTEDSIWDYLTITVGAFGYQGNILDPLDNSINRYTRAGVEADVRYKKFNLMLSGVSGKNNFSSDRDPSSQKSMAFSAEADYQFLSKAIALVRYDYVRIKDVSTTQHVIPAVTYAPLQNFRVTLEVDNEREKEDEGAKTSNTTGRLSLAYTF